MERGSTKSIAVDGPPKKGTTNESLLQRNVTELTILYTSHVHWSCTFHKDLIVDLSQFLSLFTAPFVRNQMVITPSLFTYINNRGIKSTTIV